MSIDVVPTDWETIDWIAHDARLILGRPEVDRQKVREAITTANLEGAIPIADGHQVGLAFVAAYTEADDDLPVEVQRDRVTNAIVSARLCWTNDVDDLEGAASRWVPVCSLELGAEGCDIWSPSMADSAEAYRLQAAPGTYRVEGFDHEGDLLGIRITRCAMYYNRQVPHEFLAALRNPFQPIIDFAVAKRPLIDFQLRASQDSGGRWGYHATLYAGLTAILHLHWGSRGSVRLSVADRWQKEGDFDPAWRKSADLASWQPLAAAVLAYLERIYKVVLADQRYTGKEGAVQSALAAEASPWFSVADRESVVGYGSDDERDRFTDRLKKKYIASVTAASPERWAVKTPRFGNELDVLAVDDRGRVLVVEVKGANDTVRNG